MTTTTGPDPYRSQLGRIGAHVSWANTSDRSARTAPARAAALARFEREVDPDGVLTPDERARRAEHARKAYFARLALKSAEARRRGTKGRMSPTRSEPVDLGAPVAAPERIDRGPAREHLRAEVVRRGWASGSYLEDFTALRLDAHGHRPPSVVQQHPVGRYRLDFAWPAHKVALEVDGWFHRNGEAQAKDEARDAVLTAAGWTIVRMSDEGSLPQLTIALEQAIREVEAAL